MDFSSPTSNGVPIRSWIGKYQFDYIFIGNSKEKNFRVVDGIKPVLFEPNGLYSYVK